MHKPARYLVLIDSSGGPLARLFDEDHVQLAEIDASSEEVATMTAGLVASTGTDPAAWRGALDGHSEQECRAAQVYTLAL